MENKIDLNDVIDGINRMLEVVAGKSGASPIVAKFLLSTVGKDKLDLLRFISKVDGRVYDTAIDIIYLLRNDYHTIIDILLETVDNNEKLLRSVSKMKGL